ncbi:MAG: hypothetical protein H0U52_18255 [Chloroflexi bacterium]|nr:hypothetical protein [Chloroflexota bacterium]
MRTRTTSIAAAAVLLVAIVGCQPAPGAGGSGSKSTNAPSGSAAAAPSVAASASPSATAVFPSWYTPDSDRGGSGILSAGSHTTRSFVPGFTFTVPEGWVNDGDIAGFYSLFPDQPDNAAEIAASGNLAHAIHMGLVVSPFFMCEALETNRGATAAEMVAAVEANEALATSDPVDVTIGGLTGKQIDVQIDRGYSGSCPGDPPTLDLKDMRVRGTLLDTHDRGVLVIFTGSFHAAGHDAFLSDAMPILESFQFDTGQ